MSQPVQIEPLTAQEIETLQANGMYWCTHDDACEADPVYRVSEVMRPGETVLNVLAHLCPAHAEPVLRGGVLCDDTLS